jgi:orotidine-5'-phosphate decarboxylase
MRKKNKQIIVALDLPCLKSAVDFAERLDPHACRVKIGKELFTASGPSSIEALQKRGFDVFLDLKFHDIPNTVARACEVAADLGCWMVNLHVSGGQKMLEKAVDALGRRKERPLLIGVTVLTSMSQVDLREVGIDLSPEKQVLRLTALAKQVGLDGVVCSPLETRAVRKEAGNDFILVTPGVRPARTEADDQNRIATPIEAINMGSDFLVIGRPITRAKDPQAALQQISGSLALLMEQAESE